MPDPKPKCPTCGNDPVDVNVLRYSWDWEPIYLCRHCPRSYFGTDRDIKKVEVIEKVKTVRKKKVKIDNNPKLNTVK